MSTVFLKILNISITAGWLILAVILIRLLLKKAPKWLSCLLWGLVALRLLIPFSIESALSLIPSGEVVSESIITNYSPSIDTGFVLVNNTLNPIITKTLAPRPEMKTNPMEIIVSAASIIWIAGMVAMLIYAAASYFLLKKRVSTAIPLIGRFDPKRRVFLCDGIKSPFILGIIRPAIYIPSNIDAETIQYVYAHENSHIRRHDNLWKPLGFILLCVYWFNPLCWIAYILLCKDIEAACDEKVIKDKEKDYLAFYSQALLNCAAPRKMISACPVAFGETGVKSRVKGILNYRKPAFWIILVSLIAVIAVGVCFLTNPKREEKKDIGEILNTELTFSDADTDTIEFVESAPTYVLVQDKTNGSNTDEVKTVEHFTIETDSLSEYFVLYEEDNRFTIESNQDLPYDELNYKYKKVLVGKDPNAACYGMYVVYTNNPDISYEDISRSLYSSNMEDWLTDTFILDMKPIGDNFTSFSCWPTTSERISAGFDVTGHTETDIAGEMGDPIYSVSDGVVFSTGFDETNGNFITIFCGDAQITYTHLDSIEVNDLDEVKEGDIIGKMGSTGMSTGPHVGLSILIKGTPQNIMDYYEK